MRLLSMFCVFLSISTFLPSSNAIRMQRIHRQHQQQAESETLTTQTQTQTQTEAALSFYGTLSAYNGHIYTTTNRYAIKHYTESPTTKVEAIGGQLLYQISYDGQSSTPSLCGITYGREIFCSKGALTNTPIWNRIQGPGTFEQVVIRDSKLIGVQTNGNIYYTTYDATTGKITKWSLMIGNLDYISYDGKTICGINNLVELKCHDGGLITLPRWRFYTLPYVFSTMTSTTGIASVAIEGSTIIINKIDGSIWYGTYTSGMTSITWLQMIGNYKQISIDPITKKIWALNQTQILHSTNIPTPTTVWTVQN